MKKLLLLSFMLFGALLYGQEIPIADAYGFVQKTSADLTAITDAEEGDIYYNSDIGVHVKWDGNAFVALVGSGGAPDFDLIQDISSINTGDRFLIKRIAGDGERWASLDMVAQTNRVSDWSAAQNWNNINYIIGTTEATTNYRFGGGVTDYPLTANINDITYLGQSLLPPSGFEIMGLIDTELGNSDWRTGGGSSTAESTTYDNTVSGLPATNTKEAIDELADILTRVEVYPVNSNPELLVDYGSTSYPPHETSEVYIQTGFEPLNNAVLTAVYETSNGVGQSVTQMEGDGATNSPTFRVYLESEPGLVYDIEVTINFLSGTGQVVTLAGTTPAIDQDITTTGLQTISFQVTDNTAYDGIVLAIQGFQNNSIVQFKVSQKLAN